MLFFLFTNFYIFKQNQKAIYAAKSYDYQQNLYFLLSHMLSHEITDMKNARFNNGHFFIHVLTYS